MLKKIVIVACIGVVGMAFSFWNFQESLIFYPEKLPSDYQFSFAKHRFSEVWIDVKGARLNALHFQVDKPKGVIFYLHGNAGNLASWGNVALPFVQLGYDVFILDYRGYGKSTGKIGSQKQLLWDCVQAFEYVESRYKSENIILFGRSIGTGPTVYVASQKKVSKVILETPYSSVSDLVKKYFPIIPTFLVNYKLPSDEWIGEVSAPIYIFHGTEDNVIPISICKKLISSIKGKYEFYVISGGNHNDLDDFQEYWIPMKKILE
jgi:pimeloyl-ACP methyl ester carboxylesterase